MSKFNDIYRIIMEDINNASSNLPTPNKPLSNEFCNLDNLYRWKKGEVNVYACKITEDNVEAATKFIQQCGEYKDKQAEIGKYVVYNPHISREESFTWMNRLEGYELVKDKSKSAFDGDTEISEGGLTFNEYSFTPKEKEEDMIDGTDIWVGFEIPKGMEFNVEEGCGNNGADGSVAQGTKWLPIVNGKFDFARSLGSMKQANFICLGKVDKSKVNIDQKCIDSWNKQYEQMKSGSSDEPNE